MADFIFTSPGVKFKEKSLDYVVRQLGITTLGVAGETLKGPAFEPVYIQDKQEFTNRFGNQSIERFQNSQLKYQLPYVANSYLTQSNQLWVTRVLGLSGYDAGKAWAITLSAGVDPSTIGFVSSASTAGVAFTGGAYKGVAIYTTGQTGTVSSGYTKTTDTLFSGVSYDFTVTTLTGSTGTVTQLATTYSGSSYSEYEKMVLAVIRSRGYVLDNINLAPSTIFDCDNLSLSGNTTNTGVGNMFGEFILTASSTGSIESYTVSLNPNASNFLPNVIGLKPKDKKTKIWAQESYPDLIKKLDADGIGYGINTTLIDCNSSIFSDYKTQFKTPESPWVVSQLKGSVVDRLFKFISISDGNAANEEIKISIGNINPITLEFDVLVRNFYDTDSAISLLESYPRCNLIKGTNNYIGQRIGTTDGEYSLQSKYIMVELAEGDHLTSFPAGFEGIMLNNYSISATSTTSGVAGIAPKIFYKTSYVTGEKVAKTYLGLSNSAYNGTGLSGEGINQQMFNYNGWNNGGDNNIQSFTKSKGFHLDSGATGSYYSGVEYIGQFEQGIGDFKSVANVVDTNNPYYAINTRKFTFVPTGGFDGWDVNNNARTYSNLYKQDGIYSGNANKSIPATNDYQAWQTAINTYSNPEEVTINLFSTPGLNWDENIGLVGDAIEMIEKRSDSLYVIDTPDIDIPATTTGTKQDALAAEGIADLLSITDIDTSYGATYFPFIQMRDTQNNVNVFIPPTGEVLKAIAYTDNTRYPWFAPAGLTSGVTDAKKSKYKLSEDSRGILYEGRINPLADFANEGTAIFGQKTLQVADTATNRINVRRLLLRIKVLISNVAVRTVFEQNDQTTINNFLGQVNPILEKIKAERGLYDYRVKMDDTNNTPETRDREELYGEIFLKPIRSVEFIGLTFTITPSGASFSEVGM